MAQLTPRQREIKSRLDRGMRAPDIAEDLGVTRNAIYLQIQRLRKLGALPPDFTPSGQPPRESMPGAETLARLVMGSADGDGEAAIAGSLALVEELKRTRDELDVISRRISAILPR